MTPSLSQRHSSTRCNNKASETKTTARLIQTPRSEMLQHRPASMAPATSPSTSPIPQTVVQSPADQINVHVNSNTIDNLNNSTAPSGITSNDFPQILFHDQNDNCVEDENSSFKIHRKLLRRRHVRKEQIRNKRRREEEQARQAERDERKRINQQRQLERTMQNGEQSTVAQVPVEVSPQKRLFAASPDGYGSHGNHVSLCNSPTCVRVPIFSPLRPSKRRNTRIVS